MVVFEADYDKIKFKIYLWRYFSGGITITSPKNVTKITSQKFSNLGPSQSKFLVAPVVLG